MGTGQGMGTIEGRRGNDGWCGGRREQVWWQEILRSIRKQNMKGIRIVGMVMLDL